MKKFFFAIFLLSLSISCNDSGKSAPKGSDSPSDISTTAPDETIDESYPATDDDFKINQDGNERDDINETESDSDTTTQKGELITVLTLKEPASIRRENAPLRSGVPFPKGVLDSEKIESDLSLFEKNGKQLPLQLKPLSIWDDGSIRWLLIDTEVDIASGENKQFELRRAASPMKIDNPISIKDSEEFITLDTGKMTVEVPKKYGGIVSRVWVGEKLLIDAPAKNSDRGPFIKRSGKTFYGSLLRDDSVMQPTDNMMLYRNYVDENGGDFNLHEPFDLKVFVEEEGPLHTVVRISGAHLDENGIGSGTFITRLHLYRMSQKLKIDHTVTFTDSANEKIESYGIRIPFTGTETVVEGETVENGSVTHLSYSSFLANGSSKDGQALGYAVQKGANGALGVVMRDMAEQFPKALNLDRGGFNLEFYPEAAPPLDLSRYSNSLDGPGETGGVENRSGQGVAKTDSVILVFGENALMSGAMENEAKAVDKGPLMLFADPLWYSESSVMGIGKFVFDSSKNSEVHYRIDKVLRIIADFMRYNQRKQFKWFGFSNYGDIRGLFYGGCNSDVSSCVWSEEGRYGWSGNSGEPSNQLWVQFMRHPEQAVFLDAEALAKHTLDVQMVHYGDANSLGTDISSGRNQEFSVGSLHRHGKQAWSGYAKLPEYSHVAGVETYYYLTGDMRAKETLFEAAQFISRYGVDNPGYTAMVNGVDLLSRARAVFHDNPEIRGKFETRIETLLNYLSEGAPNRVANELSGMSIDSSFGFFIRGMPGLLYHHELTSDSRAAGFILDAAEHLVSGENGDAWGLSENGNAGSVWYYLNTLTYAAAIAEKYGKDSAPYYNLAKRVLEWNCHATESEGSAAISLNSLNAVPENWEKWIWEWNEGELNPDAPALLHIARQLTFRNNYMQDYHSYRAFVHLAAAAAMIPPGEGTAR